jgi:hypothetical protein
MGIAARCYWNLRAKYPDVVFDEAFDEWMGTGPSKLEAGCMATLVDTDDCKFAETTGALHWDDTGFLAGGGLCDVREKHSEINGRQRSLGMVARLFGKCDVQGWEPDSGYCVKPKDYRRLLHDSRTVKVKRLLTRGPNKGMYEVVYKGSKGKRLARVPVANLRPVANRVEAWIDNFDLGPKHPPQETWGPPPKTRKTGTYFEFDASKLKEGHFSNGRTWAQRGGAGWYALAHFGSSSEEFGECWYSNASKAVPVRAVGRVVGPAQGSNIGPMLEVSFEYGTDKMTDGETRWGIRVGDIAAVRQFDDADEYARLLTECQGAFDAL